MTDKVRVNLANPAELKDLGMTDAEVDMIIRYRREHGPITDQKQLGALLGGQTTLRDAEARLDFSPADPTAPEAPGA